MKKIALWATTIFMLGAFLGGRTFAESLENHSSVQTTPISYVGQAFRATGATMTGYEVHDWSTLTNTFEDQAALRVQELRLTRDIGLTDIQQVSHVDAADHVLVYQGTIHISGASPSQQGAEMATIEMASMRFVSAPSQTVLIVRILETGSAETSLPVSYDEVERIIKEAGGQAQVNVTLFGTIHQMLSPQKRGQIVLHALRNVDARAAGSMADRYTTSTSAYAANWGDAIMAGTQPMNLQIAMHENGYSQTTRVLVGSPIITVEY